MSRETTARPRLVLISGSLRGGSVNSAVISTAAALAPSEVGTLIYRRMADLPHFNPDDDREPLPEPVSDLRRTLNDACAVLVSTPEYAGSLPGSFKNLLDWTVGGASLYERPVGWINPSALGGSEDTYRALRIVLERAGAEIVAGACKDIPTPRDAIGADGLISCAEIRAEIQSVVAALAERVLAKR
ncbi:NADPH-dependent FMN reductase [Methylocystis bryophila]|uniref:NADPH-dependent FMN reductase n=1 Tax=Methylocystis bryophila TaxID=655015 RepID=UPI001FD97E59|nr:NADPH-dependent FMN reductase [Methylocystis bryophila]